MSEVEFKKFAICDTCGAESLCREVGDDDQCGGCYWAPINEAKHQSELAALREELATSQLNLSIEQAKLSQVRASLTAAEQRNAALVELLRDIRDAPGGSSFNKHIDAALKPTESGASE